MSSAEANLGGKKVDIYWTDHGVPHIEAHDWYSLGYGSAYAMAEQNFCILADQLLKIKSQRSQYFGAGEGSANIVADIGNLALNYINDGKTYYKNLSPRAQQLIRGYAAGYNLYLSQHTPDQYPRPCKGAEWIKPTTEYELLAYYFSLGERASGQSLLPAAVNAAPPVATVNNLDHKKNVSFNMSAPGAYLPVAQLPDLDAVKLGSNAWSIGKDLSEDGNAMLLGNPHFPAYGALRFYQYRQRIPGVYDVQGVSLIGTPCVQIGFNDNLGWTHTVSKSRHFSLYVLELNPNNPMEYKYGTEFRPITQKDFQIQLKLPTGQVVPFSRPVFFSHYGPMIATPELKWDNASAFTYRDANSRNTDFIDEWIDMGASKNITQFKAAFKKYRGTPWVNTFYADKEGNSLYIEGTPVPKVSAATIAVWKQNPIAQFVYQKLGLFLFLGSNPQDEWQGPNPKGLTPYEEAPQLQRTDYIANSNDSHWLLNENQKLTGFSPVYGPEQSPLSYRTRMSLRMLKDQSGDDHRFNLNEVEGALFSDRAYLWENIGEELKARCATWAEDDLKEACASLSAWNGRYDGDAKGWPVFREMAHSWDPSFHKVAFNAEDPANTPSGLSDDPTVADAIKATFAKAVANLKLAGLALDAPLSQIQFFKLPDFQGGVKEKIAYHGGHHEEGVFNVQDWDPAQDLTLYPYPALATADVVNPLSVLTKEGYPINGGSSFMLLAEFTPRGPKARGILSYSQSSDPDSPYFSDQNHMYAQKQMRDFVHNWKEVEDKYSDNMQSLKTD